ncbi:MAG: hypothetical protein ACRBCI_03950 [Cellvibrionaceae bacterium]
MNSYHPIATDKDIRNDPDIKNLLSRMPVKVAESFSETQLLHLKTAVSSRKWGNHGVDFRGTLTFPFARWRYYYVILCGRNRRQLSDREHKISALMTALFVLLFLCISMVIGLLLLYLVKSFAGIDLFPGVSLGIWDYVKNNF